MVPAAAAEDAHHQRAVVAGQGLHRGRAVVGDLQEQRPPAAGHAGQRADDVVVDEPRQVGRRMLAGVRIEHLQKVPKPLGLGLDAKRLVGFQRAVVEIDVVVERDGVEAQVGAQAAARSDAHSTLPHWMWSIVAVRNGCDGCLP